MLHELPGAAAAATATFVACAAAAAECAVADCVQWGQDIDPGIMGKSQESEPKPWPSARAKSWTHHAWLACAVTMKLPFISLLLPW